MKKKIDDYNEIFSEESEQGKIKSNDRSEAGQKAKWTGVVKSFTGKQWEKHGDKVVAKATKTISKKLKVDEAVLTDLKTGVESIVADGNTKVEDTDKQRRKPRGVDSSSIADKSGKLAGKFAKAAFNQVLPGRAIKLGFWILVIAMVAVVILLFYFAIR